MEVRKVYQNSEVGVMPKDWEIVNLSEVCERISVGLATSVTKYYRRTGVPIIRNLNIKEGYFDDSDILYLDPIFAKQNQSKAAKEYDVITVHTGVNLGLTCVLPPEYNNCQTFTTLITTPIRSRLDPFFLCFHMSSFIGKKEMLKLQVGGGKGNLNTGDLKKYHFAIPPTINEQRAIANALSDADKLIKSLKKLIAKKQAIKQGTMQELLKPKEGWVEKSLGDLFEFSGGFSASRDQLSNEGYCYLHYGDIHGANKSYIDVDKELHEIPKLQINLSKVSRKSMLSDGDVVFVDASEDDEGTSRHIVIDNPKNIPFISGLHTIVAKSKNIFLYNGYKRYCFQTKDIKNQFKYYAVGTKVSGISKTNIAKIIISVPSMDEQINIANVLSDMDTEIQTLETKLAKHQQIKQGMMQTLLTGKIRLI